MLSGCVSADKLSEPKGKWIAINPAGFIPPTVEIYKRASEPTALPATAEAEGKSASTPATSEEPTTITASSPLNTDTTQQEDIE